MAARSAQAAHVMGSDSRGGAAMALGDSEVQRPLSRLPPVFICGIARSGTTLLPLLLDSHPALAVLPGETHCYRDLFYSRPLTRLTLSAAEYLEAGWIASLLLKRPMTLLSFHGRSRCLERLRDWARAASGGAGVPEQRLEDLVDHATSVRNRWSAFVEVYASLASGPDRRYWVEKTPLNERFVFLSESLFRGSCRYLHIVRDPRAVVASLVMSPGADPSVRDRTIADCCFVWARSMHQGVENARRCGERYCVVRYEDLVSRTETVMARIADYLGIEPTPSLLNPTRLGRPFPMNSSYPEYRNKVFGIVRSQVDRFRDTLSGAEMATVEGLLFEQMQAFGYEPRMASRRDGGGACDAVARWGVEGLKRYVKRRKMAWIQERFRGVRVAFVDGVWVPRPAKAEACP